MEDFEDDADDFGPCEIAGCDRRADHSAQVTRDGQPFGPPLALCDEHVVPYMNCGDAECDQQAVAVLYFSREDEDGEEDIRRVFACPAHEAELRDGATIEIDGLQFELDED